MTTPREAAALLYQAAVEAERLAQVQLDHAASLKRVASALDDLLAEQDRPMRVVR